MDKALDLSPLSCNVCDWGGGSLKSINIESRKKMKKLKSKLEGGRVRNR